MKKDKIKQTIKLIGIILCSVMFTTCKDNGISKKNEADIIKKYFLKSYAKASPHTYLVSPQYDNFEFNSFFKENKVLENYNKEYDYNLKKEEVFNILN